MAQTNRSGFRALTDDERSELQDVVARLRDLDAPDSVIETTLRDVSRQVRRLRTTAADPLSGVTLLGAVVISGLVATSLEAQRRRARRNGATGNNLALFDRLIDGVSPSVEESVGGDEPGDDGPGEDDESDRRSITPPSDQSVAAEPAAEPPPNPEDDPLFVLMTQTIAGQIVEKGVGQTTALREEIESHAKQLLPRVKELYPDGIPEEELRRIVPLGDDNDVDEFRPLEVITAVRLERKLATTLTRHRGRGDWIDPRTLETYDAVLGNIPDPRFYTFSEAVGSIQKHLEKPDVDFIVVDVTTLNETQKSEVKEYVNTELSSDQFLRVITLE